MQRINAGPHCGAGGTVHEILHAAGFVHEHTRPDRDAFVSVIFSNILPDKAHNFTKRSTALNIGPYDFGSIMHYPSNAFAYNPAYPTITRIGGSTANLGKSQCAERRRYRRGAGVV